MRGTTFWLLLFFASAGFAAPFGADLKEIERQLFEDFDRWDRLCKRQAMTGLGETFACGARHQAAVVLFYGGWCFGELDQRSSYFEWHRCHGQSNTPVEMSTRPH